MLGVFRRDLKKPDILITKLPNHSYIPALKDGHLKSYFTSYEDPSPVVVSFGTYGFMAYSADKKISPSPRPKFYMKDGIYCIYRGRGNEADRLIDCYMDIKSRNGYASPFEIMPVICGNYNFILYDIFAEVIGFTSGTFVVNCWKAMPVYYGLDSYGLSVIIDDTDIIRKVCGTSFMDISKGNGILIPVLSEIKVEPTEAKSSGGSSVVDPYKDESMEAKSSGGRSSKRGRV